MKKLVFVIDRKCICCELWWISGFREAMS